MIRWLVKLRVRELRTTMAAAIGRISRAKLPLLSRIPHHPAIHASRRGVVSKLFIGGLSVYTTENRLTEAFSQYGQVVEAKIVMDKTTGKSKNFGFVTFASGEEAEKALMQMNEKELNGRTIYVDYAKPRIEFGSTGVPIARGPP